MDKQPPLSHGNSRQAHRPQWFPLPTREPCMLNACIACRGLEAGWGPVTVVGHGSWVTVVGAPPLKSRPSSWMIEV